MPFIFSIFGSDGHHVQQSRSVCAIVLREIISVRERVICDFISVAVRKKTSWLDGCLKIAYH